MTFFPGSLQEGIAAALQQAKSVVCFVTDNQDESKTWELDYLVRDPVSTLLASQAVVLRIDADSQEEGFLTQLYPVPKRPTIIIIKNGELKEYIASGVSYDDFVQRIQRTLQPTPPPAPSPAQAVLAIPDVSGAQVAVPANSASSGSSGQATPPSPSDAHAQSAMSPEMRRQDEEARKRRLEKGKGKVKPKAESTPKKPDQSKHAEQLRKKQREAREERERILKAIEDDKAARRARQAEREAAKRAAEAAQSSHEGGGEAPLPFAPASPFFPQSGRVSEFCSLQVRMLDGSTVRSRFSSQETLKDVRQLIDQTTSRDGGASAKGAYTFKILLTPMPSRTIDVTEERKTLQELGLTPSATLILLPVIKPAGAFAAAPGGNGNIFWRLIGYILACITGFLGFITSFFSTLFSTAGPPQQSQQQRPRSESAGQTSATASGREGSKIRGVRRADERNDKRNDQQFYNGNSTNFEPRPDDD